MSNINSAMKIGIGILAYNEAEFIPTMLNSLFEQSLLTEAHPNLSLEIIVIPNGCKDDTANIAQTCLKQLVKPDIHSNLDWKVCEVEQAGKANAWNLFIHQFSNPNTDYFILMDSDIILLDPKTLESMIYLLKEKPEVWISVDKPIKDITLKPNKNFLERLSVQVSKLSGNRAKDEQPAWICGQLYCGRAEILRQMWMPTNLQMDDSFVYTMIVTDYLKSDENPNRVIQAKSASHIFEAYTDIEALLRHQKWLIFGETLNEFIYADLRANINQNQDLGSLIQQRNEQDPHWIDKLLQKMIQENKSGWLIPRFIVFRRFISLADKPLHKAILFLPLTGIAFLVDFILSVQVNRELHKKNRIALSENLIEA